MRYDTFDSNDTLETKLLTGKSGYDLVVPTAYFLERQIKAGLFQKLDKQQTAEYGNVWPEIADAACDLRSGQSLRRQLHVGHDRHRLQRQEGEAKFSAARCADRQLGHGVQAGKSREVQGMRRDDARIPPTTSCRRRCSYLGLDPNTKDTGRSSKRPPTLSTKVRPSVRKFHSSEYHQRARQAAKSVSWSAGRAISSRRRSAGAKPRAASTSATRSRRRARRCGSTISRSRRTRRMSRRRMNSSISCCGRRRRRRIRISSPMPNGNLASQKLIDQGDPQGPDGLSGRGDDEDALSGRRRAMPRRSAP